MDKILGMVLMCTVFFSMQCVADENAISSDPIGLVVSLRGQAVAVNADGQERTLAIKSKVFRGDSIRTGPTVRVQILFDDNTAISLGSESEMNLREYEYRPELKQAKFHTKLEQGDFQIKAGDTAKIAPDKFITETPLGSIGIRGSMYAGSMRDGTLKALFLGGKGIYFQNAAGTVDVSTIGQGIDLPSGFTGVPVIRQFSPAEMSQLRNAANSGNHSSRSSGSSEGSDDQKSASESGDGAADAVSSALAAGANSGGNAVQPTFDARAYIERELASLTIPKISDPDPIIPPNPEPSILYPGRLLPYSGKDGPAVDPYFIWDAKTPYGGWTEKGPYANMSNLTPGITGIAQYIGGAYAHSFSLTNPSLGEDFTGTAELNFNLGSRTLAGQITGVSTANNTVRWDFSNIKITNHQILYPAAGGSLTFHYNGATHPSYNSAMDGKFYGSMNNGIPAAAAGTITTNAPPQLDYNAYWGADYIKHTP